MTNPIDQDIQHLEQILKNRSSRWAKPWIAGSKTKQILTNVCMWSAWVVVAVVAMASFMLVEQSLIAAIGFFITMLMGGVLAYTADMFFISRSAHVQNTIHEQRHVFNILHAMGRADLVADIKCAYEDNRNNKAWWTNVRDALNAIGRTHSTQDVFLTNPTDVVEVEAQWIEAGETTNSMGARAQTR